MSNATSSQLNGPARLLPVHIPKPWGQEIWYTGMEARGESRVQVAGQELLLSEYLAQSPGGLQLDAPPLLLKVLDPRPEPVLGDLYFEVHAQKQEVYVVTHVDRNAWPDGIGGIRFGMNQQLRSTYTNDNEFRAAYVDAVQAYEAVRRRLDDGSSTADDAEQEPRLRAAMDNFSALRNLKVGDVVQVPTWTPHSLLHGVRVVEFQTPTYERYILSFAQRVLTQDHWDTKQGSARMHLDHPAEETFETVAPGVERVAQFADFNVWRAALTQDQTLSLSADLQYAVGMCISGRHRLDELNLQPEDAFFLPPATVRAGRITCRDAGQILLAAPNL